MVVSISNLPKIQTKEKSNIEIFNSFSNYTFEKGACIRRAKQFTTHICLMLTGQAIVYSRDRNLQKDFAHDYFLAGSFLNLSVLSSDAPINQFAIATTDVILKMIPVDRFQQFLRKNHELQQMVLEAVLKDSQRTQLLLIQKMKLSSRQLVIHFLIDYVKEAGKRVGYEWFISHPFSMTQIGQLTHTSRQTSSTLMNELKKAGIIHFNRKYLIVRDLVELEQLIKVSVF